MAKLSEQERVERKRSQERRRAKRYRERKKEEKAKQEKQLGVAKVELTLSSADRDRLDAMRQARAVVGEPYTREEYIAELILQDEQRYQEQVAALTCCGKCKSSLPQGCDGVFEGDRACWRTRQYREDLML